MGWELNIGVINGQSGERFLSGNSPFTESSKTKLPDTHTLFPAEQYETCSSLSSYVLSYYKFILP